MTVRLFVVIAIVFAVLAASVQQVVARQLGLTGYVSNGLDPVSGAVVTLVCGGIERSTTTDVIGAFRFADGLATTCTVTVDAAGFERQRRQVRVGDRAVSFALSASAPGSPPQQETAVQLTSQTSANGVSAAIRRGFSFSSEYSGPMTSAGTSPISNSTSWAYRSALSYSTGGQSVGVALSATHGQALPQYMSDGLGVSGSSSPSMRHVDVTGSRVLDAKVFVRKRLFGWGSGNAIDGVAEAHLPLNPSFTTTIPWTLQPLRSRALRFGLVVSY